MYAVGGEPGLSPNAGISFLFFFLFFFFSNYILLNLFVAVILGNFAATMREHQLSIGEHDFEVFKYSFRDMTSDESPEMLPFHSLWELLTKVGLEGTGVDDKSTGGRIESSLAPVPTSAWTEANQTSWQECCQNVSTSKATIPGVSPDPLYPVDVSLETDNVKEVLQRLYDAACSPIGKDSVEPGDTFAEYWEKLVSTSSIFQSCGDNVSDELRRWDPISRTIASREKEGWSWAQIRPEIGAVLLTDLQVAVRSLRFRIHYRRVVDELAFHAVHYDPVLADKSKIRYDQLIQSLVNVKMGDDALSLEDQIARGQMAPPVLAATFASKLMRSRQQSRDRKHDLGSPSDLVVSDSNGLVDPESGEAMLSDGYPDGNRAQDSPAGSIRDQDSSAMDQDEDGARNLDSGDGSSSRDAKGTDESIKETVEINQTMITRTIVTETVVTSNIVTSKERSGSPSVPHDETGDDT